MIRSLVILINVVGAVLINAFVGAYVTLNVNVPETVDAGQEFRVQVTINKGDLTSFARFQQTLPPGLKAIEVNSASAVDFTFEDNRVRILWLRLPEEEEFTFSYRVRVDERLKGVFSLSGTFSYIEDNERKSMELLPEMLAINPSPSVDQELIVDINDFAKRYIQDLTPTAEPGILGIREEPSMNATGEYFVNILINKNDLKQFAKIEEKIPEGYTAYSVENQEGIFTFNNQVAKIIWRNLPAKPYFIVTYKVVPNNPTATGSPDIEGTFSYFESDRTEVVDVIEKNIDLLAMSESQLQNLIVDETGVELFADKDGVTGVANGNKQGEKNTIESNNTTTTTQDGSENMSNQATTNSTGTKTTQNSSTTTRKIKKETSSNQVDVQDGVYYRVQIAAGHKPVNINRYFNKFKLEKEVKKEKHDGWIKYSVGSFEVYKDARDYRVHIWNTTQINDAFVAAYNSGERITVQEALMIANQKWYK